MRSPVDLKVQGSNGSPQLQCRIQAVHWLRHGLLKVAGGEACSGLHLVVMLRVTAFCHFSTRLTLELLRLVPSLAGRMLQ